MKNWLATRLLTAGMIIVSILQPTSSTAQSQRNVYSCIEKNGVPVTVVDTERGRVELIVWKSDYFRASGWTPSQRCKEVIARLQNFSDGKKLIFITTGTIKEYPVICVGQATPLRGYNCMRDGLLITLQKGENPNQVLESLFKQATQVVGGGMPVSKDPEAKYIFNINNYLTKYPFPESSTGAIDTNKPTETPPTPEQQPASNCPSFFCD